MDLQHEAIVLKLDAYKEADGLVCAYGEEGIFRFFAKGVFKMTSKNVACVQPFTHASFQFVMSKGKESKSLMKGEILHYHRCLKEDLLKNAMANLLVECLLGLEPIPYLEFLQLLELLEKSDQPYCVLAFALAILCRVNGVEPYIDGCIICGDLHAIQAFSYKKGGFICHRCLSRDDVIYSKNQLRAIRALFKARLSQYPLLEQLDNWDLSLCEQLLDFLQYHTGFSAQALKFLKVVDGLKEGKI